MGFQEWSVFKDVSALLILVPPLLGLKGNLDMCLASRLSTQANMGKMDSWHDIWKMIVGNVAVVQVRGALSRMALWSSVINQLKKYSKPLNTYKLH